MSPQRFDELVSDALDLIPPELAAAIDNVVVLVEDRNPDEPDLLGPVPGRRADRTRLVVRGFAARHHHDLPRRAAGHLRDRGRGRRRGGDHRHPRDRPPLRHRRRPAARTRLGVSAERGRARQPRFVRRRCYERAMTATAASVERGSSTATAPSSITRWHRSECTEDGCVTPEVVHAFSIDCDALGALRCPARQPIGSADCNASSTGWTSGSG